MTEQQEFIYLLRRHPELHDQIWQIINAEKEQNNTQEGDAGNE